jgi:abortive infection bacteriophage resistance protein
MPENLATYIGSMRATKFLEALPTCAQDRQVELYIFDLNLRALVMKSMSIIEISLDLEIAEDRIDGPSETFGDMRRRIRSLKAKEQFRISKRLGFANQREMNVSLRNLNSLRNRAAHHEPIWRSNLHFGVPLFRESENYLLGITSSNRYLPAASILVISAILSNLPKLIDFELEFKDMLESSKVERYFLLKNMGFEVP